jgi:exoribonuclease R
MIPLHSKGAYLIMIWLQQQAGERRAPRGSLEKLLGQIAEVEAEINAIVHDHAVHDDGASAGFVCINMMEAEDGV